MTYACGGLVGAEIVNGVSGGALICDFPDIRPCRCPDVRRQLRQMRNPPMRRTTTTPTTAPTIAVEGSLGLDLDIICGNAAFEADGAEVPDDKILLVLVELSLVICVSVGVIVKSRKTVVGLGPGASVVVEFVLGVYKM